MSELHRDCGADYSSVLARAVDEIFDTDKALAGEREDSFRVM
jgi:hypothetical protein